ncbi:FlgO family outer membrane protein [Desulfovibrio sp. ZJ369]|uniref:FlgO family outer membrane protein n=1 Tax=Desulfovibrio sp. ZJ369 TaxID=2709793 RepID=UPI0013ED61D6|nr:FlgO family outer membrane protein [Desulfovibrio sp. ZJ369]
MSRFIVVILVFAALLFPLTAAAIGTVPKAANSIAEQMDAQLMMRYAGNDPDIDKKQRFARARAGIMIMGTTPVNLNNLEKSSPLGRQMTEEISRWLINAGYRYQELRKGRYIRFDRRKGEFILTRDVRKLARTVGTSQAVLAGTYVVSSEQVRFSISLIHTTSNEVLAKGTATVPITDDLLPLLEDPLPGSGYMPTVYTRLQ